MSLRIGLSLLLAVLLSWPAPGMAQQSPPSPTAPPGFVPPLTVFVLQGRNNVNLIQSNVPAQVVVEVRDQNNQPVEGAEVTFQLPENGPGGSFPGQKAVFTAQTNLQGQAGASYLHNQVKGRFDLRVTAMAGNRMGSAVIAQSNGVRLPSEERGGLLKFRWWKVAVLAGVGATIGIILASRGSRPTITLSPGPPVFGTP